MVNPHRLAESGGQVRSCYDLPWTDLIRIPDLNHFIRGNDRDELFTPHRPHPLHLADRAVTVDGGLQGIVLVRLADVKQVDQAIHAGRGHAVGLGRVELDLSYVVIMRIPVATKYFVAPEIPEEQVRVLIVEVRASTQKLLVAVEVKA